MENVDAATGGGSKSPGKSHGDKGASRKLQVDDFLISGAKVDVTMTGLGGKSLDVSLPDIHFTGLGTGPEGITAGELTQKVLGQVTVATLKAVEKALADIGKGATEAAKDAAGNLDKTAKGIGDLFKKK
jgi:hypothetical protein